MHFQADLRHPLGDRGEHGPCLPLCLAVQDHIVRVALKRDGRKLPAHPRIERVVEEDVG
jgi:hypothetical protein